MLHVLMSKVSRDLHHDAHDLYAQEGVGLVILKRWRGWGVGRRKVGS